MPIEVEHRGLFVAAHFICKDVKNKYTLEKACKKISTYLHTTYISCHLQQNCMLEVLEVTDFFKQIGKLSVHPYLHAANFW